MNQPPTMAPPEALHDLRNAAFERARYCRDVAAWLRDAAEVAPRELLRSAEQYEAMATQEESFVQRVDLSIQTMGRGPAPLPDAPQRFLREIEGRPEPSMTTAPGEAARQMGGPAYRAPGNGMKGGIGEAEPTPQTAVQTVKYEKGEPRPPEFTTGHMDRKPRTAAELREHRDKLRDQSFQRWLDHHFKSGVTKADLVLETADADETMNIASWGEDELAEAATMNVEIRAAAATDASNLTGEQAYTCLLTLADGKVVRRTLRVMGTFKDEGGAPEETEPTPS